MIGKPITLLVPEWQRHMTDNSERLQRGDTIPAIERMRITKDGRIINVLSSISPIKNDTGDVVGAAVIVRDISAGGVKIQNAFGLVPGDPITLEFLTRRKIEGQIAWSVPPYCGVKFNTPLHSDDPLLTMAAPRVVGA